MEGLQDETWPSSLLKPAALALQGKGEEGMEEEKQGKERKTKKKRMERLFFPLKMVPKAALLGFPSGFIWPQGAAPFPQLPAPCPSPACPLLPGGDPEHLLGFRSSNEAKKSLSVSPSCTTSSNPRARATAPTPIKAKKGLMQNKAPSPATPKHVKNHHKAPAG